MKLRLDNGPLLSALVVLVLGAWMLSGQVGQPEAAPPRDRPVADAAPAVPVQVRRQVAETVEKQVLVQGSTAAGRAVTVRAELAGRVAAVGAREGTPVAAAALIARLHEEDLPQRLQRAADLAEQRRVEYEAARSLRGKGHLSEARLAEARSLLSAARAELAAIELARERTRIVAPFDGVLDSREVEPGDYVKVGDSIARVLDFSPWIIAGDVSEAEAPQVQTGAAATAALADGRQVSGRVRYVAAEADPATRTVRIEVEVADFPGRPVAGMSAALRIPVATVRAHRVSPALLTLDDSGRLGLKVVTGDNRVRLYPVRIVRADSYGVWVDGLPDEIDLITVGAGFVAPGERVRPVAAEKPATTGDREPAA